MLPPVYATFKTKQETIIITNMQEVKMGRDAKPYDTAHFISSSVCTLMTGSGRFVGLFGTYQAGRSRRRREVWLATNTPGCNAR